MGLFSSSATDIDPELLATAAHELGHAVAWQQARVPLRGLYVHRNGAGDCKTKTIRITDDDQARAWLVGFLTGFEAEDRWRRKHKAGRAHRAASRHDFDVFNQYRRELGLSEGKARSLARSLVRSRWGQIERLTPKLATRGYLASV